MKSTNPNNSLQNANKSTESVTLIDDTLTQILLKVPIKPLIHFKLVDKHWLSLITSHGFCIMRNPTPNSAQGFFLGVKKSLQSYSLYHYQYQYIPLYPNSFVPSSIKLDFTMDPLKTVILHSCNGILLCCSSNTCNDIATILFKSNCMFYVFNPTTKMSTALPDMPDLSVYADLRSHKVATLVFDPVKSSHYNVVLVVTNGPICKIKIYSSDSGCWSDGGEIDIGINRHVDVFVSGVYWNGSVHWFSRELHVDKISLRFHVDTKMLYEMPSPPVVRDQSYRTNYYFGESCGHLHFVEPVLPKFNVYETKMDYSEWFVKYRVDLSLFIADHPDVIMQSFRNQNYDLIYVLYYLSFKERMAKTRT